MPDDTTDQRLFGRKVIVEGGDIDAGLRRHVSCTQALEAGLGQSSVRGTNELLAPRFRIGRTFGAAPSLAAIGGQSIT
jgi:hypothetical protein